MTADSTQHVHGGSANDSEPSEEVAELTLAERARTLVELGTTGVLSTLSVTNDGWPYGSVMPYTVTEAGAPVLLMSRLAEHTKNVRKNERASLLIAESINGEQSLAGSRVTLMGTVSLVEDEQPGAYKKSYLEKHPKARYWVDYDDFDFYALSVTRIYYIGGFGVMGWVGDTEYQTADVDPLAESAQSIIDHVNDDHADAMRLLARTHGPAEVKAAAMTGIDHKGFDLRVESDDGVKRLRLAFPSPVRSPGETRSALVEMINDARG